MRCHRHCPAHGVGNVAFVFGPLHPVRIYLIAYAIYQAKTFA
jgi:hypothetical protein